MNSNSEKEDKEMLVNEGFFKSSQFLLIFFFVDNVLDDTPPEYAKVIHNFL